MNKIEVGEYYDIGGIKYVLTAYSDGTHDDYARLCTMTAVEECKMDTTEHGFYLIKADRAGALDKYAENYIPQNVRKYIDHMDEFDIKEEHIFRTLESAVFTTTSHQRVPYLTRKSSFVDKCYYHKDGDYNTVIDCISRHYTTDGKPFEYPEFCYIRPVIVMRAEFFRKLITNGEIEPTGQTVKKKSPKENEAQEPQFKEGQTVAIRDKEYIVIGINPDDKKLTLLMKYCDPDLIVSGSKSDQESMCNFYKAKMFNNEDNVDVDMMDISSFDRCPVEINIFHDNLGSQYSWLLKSSKHLYYVNHEGRVIDTGNCGVGIKYAFRPMVTMSFDTGKRLIWEGFYEPPIALVKWTTKFNDEERGEIIKYLRHNGALD